MCCVIQTGVFPSLGLIMMVGRGLDSRVSRVLRASDKWGWLDLTLSPWCECQCEGRQMVCIGLHRERDTGQQVLRLELP